MEKGAAALCSRSDSWKQAKIVLLEDFFYKNNDFEETYRKTSNIRRTSLGNKIVDNSDVAGASPVGAAPTTSSFST